MSVKTAHAASVEELNKYDFIFSLNHFSIAKNVLRDKTLVLNAFKHTHDEYEFIIPVTTIPLLYYAKANYIGEVGFCYPVNPYVEHGIEVDLHSKVISITVDKEYVESIKKECGYEGKFFYTRFLYKQSLIDLINQFEEEYNKEEVGKTKKLNDLAYKIVTMLVKLGLQSGEDNRRPEKQCVKNMKNVLMYIEENYQDPDLTIAKIAEYSGYSLAYFTKAFKSYMSDTPIMHLNKRRISHAKALFQDEKLSLSAIAKRSGYKNLSTFTEAFKRVMGMLPTEYKKKYI